VAQLGGWHVSGYLAWLVWVFVHVLLLIGFRNRLTVMHEWVWAYFTRNISARLITGDMDAPTWKGRKIEVTTKLVA
jgi:NADH dehydrogenase